VRSIVAEPSSTVQHSVGPSGAMGSLPVREENQLFVDEFDGGCLSVVPESVDDDGLDNGNVIVSSTRSEDISPGSNVRLTQRTCVYFHSQTWFCDLVLASK
jgi:hypothetical protein